MMTEAGRIQRVCWSFGAIDLKALAASLEKRFWGDCSVCNPTHSLDRPAIWVCRDDMARLNSDPVVGGWHRHRWATLNTDAGW